MAASKTPPKKKTTRAKTTTSRSTKKVTARSAQSSVTPVATLPSEPRHFRTPKKRFWQRAEKSQRIRPKLPSVWRLSRTTARLLIDNWQVLSSMALIYGVLTILLVRGLNGGTDVSQVKQQFESLLHGALGHLAASFTIFALLLTSSTNAANDVAGVYQLFLAITTSLAIVWVFRQRLNNVQVRVRDGFYLGMYPLIPTILVLIVVALQLIPMLIGTWVYSVILRNEIAITGAERGVAIAFLVVMIAITVYMWCSSLFALYIVTLPGMTPMKALRSARELVRYRRWQILRKLLFMPIVLLVSYSLIMLPFILFVPVLAQWIFFVITMATLAIVHAYMYTLYREMLHE